MSRSALSTVAARTTTYSSSDVESGGARGAIIYLNCTVDPAGGETLAAQIEAKDPVSGNYAPMTTTTAVATPTTELLLVFPGVAETVSTTHMQVQAVPLPRVFRIKVTHSSTGAWTYTLGYDLIS